MPGFSGSVDLLDLDLEGYDEALRSQILSKFKGAIRAFILAAAPQVPVDTGMARGSFLNLGRLVGLNIPIPSSSGAPKTYYGPSGTRLPKTPESGDALTRSTVEMRRKGVVFSFRSRVFHYTLNEFFGLPSNNGIPWASLEAGREAFFQHLRQENLFPDIREYLIKTTITFSDRGIKRARPVRLRKQRKIR